HPVFRSEIPLAGVFLLKLWLQSYLYSDSVLWFPGFANVLEQCICHHSDSVARVRYPVYPYRFPKKEESTLYTHSFRWTERQFSERLPAVPKGSQKRKRQQP